MGIVRTTVGNILPERWCKSKSVSECASPGEMGRRDLTTRGDGLAGSQTGCEPVEVVGDACYEHGKRARGGFMEGASPWRWSEMGVTGMVSGLAGGLG